MTDPFARIADYYGELVHRHGHHSRSADYGSPEAQDTKFRVLSELLPVAGRRILDVGCGFADWATWLDAHVGPVEYVGIDLSPAMVEGAKLAHPQTDVRVANLLDGDITGPYDVVTANGIFYLLGEDAKELMEQMVTKMFDICTVAAGFTTLSAWAREQDEGEFYADPIGTIQFCRSLTPWVVLRHDYHHRDFAIGLYRERQA